VWQRLRRRRRRPPPKTLAGAIGVGLLRIAIALAAGTAVALVASAVIDRSTAVGFYIAGAIMLAIAFMTSAADINTPFYGWDDQEHHELQVSRSFSYIFVGLVLVGIGVVLEAT
jgi:hypothetical protein